MYGISKNMTGNMKWVVVVLVAMTLSLSALPGFNTEARANDGAAFLGGIVAGHVVGGAIRRDQARTAAQVDMANQQRAAAQAPAPAARQTPQQKLQQLDQLAAGGYITKEEYQAKRKAILDSM